jgi:short-chain fatty acids transporter
VVGLFIPSGGAQWAVQGPVAIGSALQLGVAPSTIVMSIAYGDELANMVQPFWALPLLAVTGVKARDIIGYTILLMLLSTVWIGACLLLF